MIWMNLHMILIRNISLHSEINICEPHGGNVKRVLLLSSTDFQRLQLFWSIKGTHIIMQIHSKGEQLKAPHYQQGQLQFTYFLGNKLDTGCYSDVVPGSGSRLMVGCFCVEFVCSPRVGVGFLPQSKSLQYRLIGDSNLTPYGCA